MKFSLTQKDSFQGIATIKLMVKHFGIFKAKISLDQHGYHYYSALAGKFLPKKQVKERTNCKC